MGCVVYSDQSPFLQDRPARLEKVAWNDPGWFILRRLRSALAGTVERLRLPATAQVLDFGCADAPYRRLFPAGADYLAADLPGNTRAAVTISPQGTLPLADASVDVVLSTQVLEHASDPASYLRECFRVLRPGAPLILTTHGFWVYHRDPVDYWRWTADGLRFLAEKEGLAVQTIDGLGGLTAVAVQLFQDATRPHVLKLLRPLYTFVMQRLAALFDLLHSATSRRQNALVLVMVARKPPSPPRA